MERIIRFFSTNSILVNFITILILLLGLITVFSIKKEARPPVSMGTVIFNTYYPGASSSDVESLISIPLEEEIAKVQGLRKLVSTSYVGLSRIYVEIDPDSEDEDNIISALYRAVSRVTLPEGAVDTEAFEVKTDSFAVLAIVLYSKNGIKDLYAASDIIENRLKSLTEVAEIEARGKEDPVFDVEVEPKKLDEYQLSLSDIIFVLKNYNLSAPAGSIISDKEDTQIRFFNELDNEDKISNLVIRVNEFGKGITVREIAKVKRNFKDSRNIYRFNGQDALGLEITKASGADTVKTVDKVKVELDKIKSMLPEGVDYEIVWDDSYYINDTLRFATQNALMGLALVLITLFLGLRSIRMSVLTSLGLPIAFLGSIIIINYLGYTLNMMTLIGIILVVGMLVDDSIVVAESISHSFENGLPPKEAVVQGTMKVISPVIAAVGTTVLAFLPLIFMEGIMGKFMRVIPVAVITALVVSLIECFLILPNHILEFIKIGGEFKFKRDSIFKNIENKYVEIVNKLLNRKFIVTVATFSFLIISFIISVSILKIELFSMKGIPYFTILLQGKENIPIEETLEVSSKIERALSKYIPSDIKGISYNVGTSIKQHGVFLDVGTNYSTITIYFPDLKDRVNSEEKTIENIRKTIKDLNINDFNVTFDLMRGGPPTGKPVDIEIKGESLDEIVLATKDLKEKISKIKGLTDITDNLDKGKYEYRLILDQKIARELGISAFDVQYLAMSAFEGIKITSVRKGEDEYEIRVIYPKEYRNSIDKLLSLNLKTGAGTYVPIRKIVSVEKANSPSLITRTFQRRYMNITADVDSKTSVKEANLEVQNIIPEIKEKHKTVDIKLSGEAAEIKDIIKDVSKIAIIAFIAIYMIVSLIFNDIRYPIFIVMAIPFGVIGAMLALIFHGVPISLAVLIALVGISGVVVNDSILLVSTIKNNYKGGMEFRTAVIESARRRFRPIALTSITTLAGVFPAAYELFGANDFMRHMSLVMGWGLLFATLMTMFLLPSIIYSAYLIIINRRINKLDTNKSY